MRSGAWSASGKGLISATEPMLMDLFYTLLGATIHHMSPLELLFALLLVCMLAATGAVAALVWNLVRRADLHSSDVAELRSRLERGGARSEERRVGKEWR